MVGVVMEVEEEVEEEVVEELLEEDVEEVVMEAVMELEEEAEGVMEAVAAPEAAASGAAARNVKEDGQAEAHDGSLQRADQGGEVVEERDGGGDEEADEHQRRGEAEPDERALGAAVVDGGGVEVAVEVAREDGAFDQVGDHQMDEEREGAPAQSGRERRITRGGGGGESAREQGARARDNARRHGVDQQAVRLVAQVAVPHAAHGHEGAELKGGAGEEGLGEVAGLRHLHDDLGVPTGGWGKW